MKFRIVEENELEKRAKYHRKRQKGMSPFYSPDGGNVPLAIDRFNNSVADGANGLCEDLGTSRKAQIVLDYYDEGGLCSEHVEDAIYTLWPNYYSLYSSIDELSENQLKTVYDYIVDKYQTEIDIYGDDADLPYPAYELFKHSLDFSTDKDVNEDLHPINESNYEGSYGFVSLDAYKKIKQLSNKLTNILNEYDHVIDSMESNAQSNNDLDTLETDAIYKTLIKTYQDNYEVINLLSDMIRNGLIQIVDDDSKEDILIDLGIYTVSDLQNLYDNLERKLDGIVSRNEVDTSKLESFKEDFKHNPLKAVVLSAIDFLWDAGFPHPDNWISDNWMNLKDGVETGVDDLVETAENLKSYLKSYMDGKNSVLDIEGADANYDLIHILTDFYYDIDKYMNKSESLKEDTVKNSDGTWSNKGDEGSHGKFRTKKQADNQRKAMFANGYKEDWNVKYHNDLDSEFGYDPGPGTLLVDNPKAYPMDKSTAKSIARNLSKNAPEFMSYWAEEDTDEKDMYESLKESVDIDDAKLEKELTNIFNQNHLYPEEMYVKNGEIYVYISNGDWKHEHLRCKWLVNEFIGDQGLVTVDYFERVTDDDGSDTYSAEHIWKVSTEDDVDEVDFTKYNFNI